MNIEVKNLNINGTPARAFGGKSTKKEAKFAGFETPKGVTPWVAVVAYDGKTFEAYGMDFEDAVDTVCKEIRYYIYTTKKND